MSTTKEKKNWGKYIASTLDLKTYTGGYTDEIWPCEVWIGETSQHEGCYYVVDDIKGETKRDDDDWWERMQKDHDYFFIYRIVELTKNNYKLPTEDGYEPYNEEMDHEIKRLKAYMIHLWRERGNSRLKYEHKKMFIHGYTKQHAIDQYFEKLDPEDIKYLDTLQIVGLVKALTVWKTPELKQKYLDAEAARSTGTSAAS